MNDKELSLYQRIGGENSVRQLVTRFYDHMETLEEARHLLSLHNDLADSREKLYQYFTGWFGGPPLFVEKYGHPRLRARHNHVEIGVADRDVWLMCLVKALSEMRLAPELQQDLMEKIAPMADHMRNLDEDEPPVDC